MGRQQHARHLDAKLQAMQSHVRETRDRVDSLRRTVAKEDADVERLERCSFSWLLSKLSGKTEENLSQERMEAYTQVRLDADTTRLEQLERAFEALRQERACLGDPDGDHAATRGAKEPELTQSAAPAGIALAGSRKNVPGSSSSCGNTIDAHRAGVEAQAQKQIRTVLANTNISEAHRA